MSVLFLAIALATGAAAAAVGLPILRNRKSDAARKQLLQQLPMEFESTHTYSDAKAEVCLACNLKQGSVAIVSRDQDEPAVMPIKQLESVELIEEGKKRVSEVRLDIGLADERRTVFKVHFLNSPSSRASLDYQHALELAEKWQARLAPESQDVNTLRAALTADTETVAQPATWKLGAAGGLAASSVLAVTAFALVKPAAEPSLGAAVPTPTPILAAAQTTAPTPRPEPIDATALIAGIIDPLEPKIEDLSEQSLSQSRRTAPDKLVKVTDDINAIALEFEIAQEIAADDDKAQAHLDESLTYYLAIQQDVLPRFRRLYSTTLQRRDELPLDAVTGGYASREITVANPTLSDATIRDELFLELNGMLQKLRFDNIDFRTSLNGDILDQRRIDSVGDGVLIATRRSASDVNPLDAQASSDGL